MRDGGWAEEWARLCEADAGCLVSLNQQIYKNDPETSPQEQGLGNTSGSHLIGACQHFFFNV